MKNSILFLTHDDSLWQHWSVLDQHSWSLTRGFQVADLAAWRDQGHRLAVIDTGLDEMSGWQPEDWQRHARGLKRIVASMSPNDEEGLRAIAAGAMGYCHAYAPVTTLTHILQTVEDGSVWMGASLVSRLLRRIDTHVPALDTWHHAALSARECTIALHVARGKSNRDIATETGVSERTIKAHLSAIFEKLGVTDRLQLALRVHGMMDAPAAHAPTS